MDNCPTKNFVFVSWNVRGLGDDDKCCTVHGHMLGAAPSVLCIQETKLASVTASKARSFLPPVLSLFVVADTDGSRGGMLTAYDPRVLNLINTDTRRFSLSTSFVSATSEAAFTITNVYAPSDHSLTTDFVAEMEGLATSVSGPWIILGDFNLIRSPSEKNNSNFNPALAGAFNATIHSMALFELPLLDRRFTWTNGQDEPTLARLDRVFFNHAWNDCFPASSLTSLLRPTSDHVPLVVTASMKILKSAYFRFENSWLLDPDFLPTTIPHWNRAVPVSNAAAVLATKVKRFRFAAKVWKKSHRFIPTYDNNCRFVIDLFDFFEEHRNLSAAELALRRSAREALALSIKQCAAHWKQRGKFRAVREGDKNTKFFHARASQRLRRNSIRSLAVDGAEIIDHEGKAVALHAFYTDLLGRARPTSWGFCLDTLYAGTARANGQALIAPFDRKEIKAAVWGMDRSSAPGPDGLGPSFFRAAWDHVATDLDNLFHDFHNGSADLSCINRAHVALLPKAEGLLAPSSFRPVSLQNCSMKMICRALTWRLQLQIGTLIDENQSGFMQGRSISENFVYATEIVQVCHKRKVPAVALKLDFAKAFDSIDWGSLRLVLEARGFPSAWCDWMDAIFQSSKSAILLNNVPGRWIELKRGLR
jgi:exonuclease III